MGGCGPIPHRRILRVFGCWWRPSVLQRNKDLSSCISEGLAVNIKYAHTLVLPMGGSNPEWQEAEFCQRISTNHLPDTNLVQLALNYCDGGKAQ